MSTDSESASAKHLSITGKMVTEDGAPTHIMQFSRPVPIPEELKGKAFDKKEEEVAACEIRNISRKEIKARYKISNAGMIVSLIGMAFFMFKGEDLPRYYRLVMNAPFAVWIGYYLSASQGI